MVRFAKVYRPSAFIHRFLRRPGARPKTAPSTQEKPPNMPGVLESELVKAMSRRERGAKPDRPAGGLGFRDRPCARAGIGQPGEEGTTLSGQIGYAVLSSCL